MCFSAHKTKSLHCIAFRPVARIFASDCDLSNKQLRREFGNIRSIMSQLSPISAFFRLGLVLPAATHGFGEHVLTKLAERRRPFFAAMPRDSCNSAAAEPSVVIGTRNQ